MAEEQLQSLSPEEHVERADRALAAATKIKAEMDARESSDGAINGKATPWYLAKEHDFLTLTTIVNLHANMANAKALLQMSICGHGVRGYCPHCLQTVTVDNPGVVIRG